METFTVTLQVDGMKHTLRKALDAHFAGYADEVQKAIETACSDENVARVLKQAADAELEKALTEAVSNFYRYGEGRGIVGDIVASNLRKRHKLAEGLTPTSENARVCEAAGAKLVYDEKNYTWVRYLGDKDDPTISAQGNTPAEADERFVAKYTQR